MDADASSFAGAVLDWYRRYGRHDLPWQGQDAYRVWLSEIMLQQTQVSTVIPYYQNFLERFPDIDALAAASVDEIVGRITKAIAPNTRLLVVTWVQSCTGMKLPIRAIADAVAEVNKRRDAGDRDRTPARRVGRVGQEAHPSHLAARALPAIDRGSDDPELLAVSAR